MKKFVYKLNQRKNTQSVINWCNKVKNKQKHKFIKFDITDFYHSIPSKTPTRSAIIS